VTGENLRERNHALVRHIRRDVRGDTEIRRILSPKLGDLGQTVISGIETIARVARRLLRPISVSTRRAQTHCARRYGRRAMARL
jgi:hypothetical protein